MLGSPDALESWYIGDDVVSDVGTDKVGCDTQLTLDAATAELVANAILIDDLRREAETLQLKVEFLETKCELLAEDAGHASPDLSDGIAVDLCSASCVHLEGFAGHATP
eukprot:4950234-Karenia_brevis.AAC.1